MALWVKTARMQAFPHFVSTARARRCASLHQQPLLWTIAGSHRALGSLARSMPMSPVRRIELVSGHLDARTAGSRSYTTPDIASKPGVTVAKSDTTNGSLATITISNPKKLNIVNTSVLDQLISACNDLSCDTELRAVVLTGGETASGKAPSFIGGADINEMHQLRSSDEARAFISRIHTACQALRDLPVPVIASVHGFALGAGLEIMAACDLRVATKDSIFGMPEVKVGIPSVVEAALLPGLIGMGRTRRLLYLAENVDASTAERWGLVEYVVNDNVELDDVVRKLVANLSSMGPKAIRSQKRLMQVWENSTVDDGIQAGVEAFAEAFQDGGGEPREYLGSFVNRRK